MHFPTQFVVVCAIACFAAQAPTPPAPAAKAVAFAYPCTNYVRGLQNGGNFGLHVTDASSPFKNSWHLAEDVWLPAGTEVRAIADGVVRYSAFSPTWTDEKQRVHWNLGNVIVIEHALDPPVEKESAICSFHVHLAADRRVQVGDRVTRGQVIGRIGADRSAENGRYPAHLHFGIHRGPYLQIPPAFERGLRAEAASKNGLRAGPLVMHGEIEVKRHGETDVMITSQGAGGSFILSLLVGSTAPKDPPPDIMCWCEGYGPEATLAEWFAPAKFLARNGAR